MKKSGFTLVEVLIAMTIGFMIAALVTSVSVATLRDIRTARAHERLQANAISIISSVGYLIKQSARIDVKNPTELEITMPDVTKKTITLSVDHLTLNGAAITSDDVMVTYFKLIEGGQSVRMGFSLQLKNTTTILSATTTLARRNAL
jgi:prepilin-type N-terminal cleavage/methylation domain-containing protein